MSIWQATITVVYQYPVVGPDGKTRWGMDEGQVSASGTTQMDAKDRLGDKLARVTRGDRTVLGLNWPEGAEVISIVLVRPPRLERVA